MKTVLLVAAFAIFAFAVIAPRLVRHSAPEKPKPTARDIAAEYVRTHNCTPGMEWTPMKYLANDGSVKGTRGRKTYDCEGVYVEVDN